MPELLPSEAWDEWLHSAPLVPGRLTRLFMPALRPVGAASSSLTFTTSLGSRPVVVRSVCRWPLQLRRATRRGG